jgi:hypothetical protein
LIKQVSNFQKGELEMKKDLNDEKISDEKPKDEQAASFTRRQILNMGWSLPVAFGLSAILSTADAGVVHADGGGGGGGGGSHCDMWENYADHIDTSDRNISSKIYPAPFRQDLLRDIEMIRSEMNTLKTKLNMTREGQDLSKISSAKIEELFQSLSVKIKKQASQSGIKTTQNLSNSADKGITIINGFEKNIGTRKKSASLEQLNQLDKLLSEIVSEIKR